MEIENLVRWHGEGWYAPREYATNFVVWYCVGTNKDDPTDVISDNLGTPSWLNDEDVFMGKDYEYYKVDN